MISEIKLCPRCEEFVHIKPQYRLCDPCEMEVLKVWQHNAIALKEEEEQVA